ncbi:MAG: carboxypeptidase-like regulatory domain-containing protein, partial [Candidatus Altiarchaeota archaeon]|nr:carboxypeptidase-like regulatory domain-containing protein [Candidatus Altiarchaeota archaeon]
YDAIIMANGEKVCEAGGIVGLVLDWVRKLVVFIAEQLDTTVDPNSICAEATGTVAWTCGDVLFIVNSPDDYDNSMSVAETLYSNAEKLKLCTESSLNGTITNGHGNPMPFIKLTATFDGKDYSGRSDADGKYDIRIKDFYPDEMNPKDVKLKVDMTYERDGKNYYTVIEVVDANNIISLEKDFKLKKTADKTQNVDFMINAPAGAKSFVAGDSEYKSATRLENMNHFAATYYHMHEAVDFALTQLKANIDYKLPVDVRIGGGDGTYYTPGTSTIFIDASDGGYGNSNRPKNREYHEFGHHVMYATYGDWPPDPAGTSNHNGYINPKTGDSFTEGWAEFYALLVSEYRKDPKPDVYASFGSMETNRKAFSHRGYDEELAICGILWNLYDKNNDKGDTVSVSRDKMWEVLKVKRDDFYEYYKAFKSEFPDKADSIDKIFIEHGFFADKNPGSGNWSIEEPYIDSNGNKAYDVGEPFVDYGEIPGVGKPWMMYDAGETIGKATNYNRQNRSLAGYVPDGFLKVSDTQVSRYRVFVHFNKPQDGSDYDYPVDVIDGMIYLSPPPDDVDLTITVKPDSQDYSASSVYTITSKQYNEKYYKTPEGTGYMDSHTFNLKPTGTNKDVQYDTTLNGAKPSFDTDKGHDVSSGGCCCLPLLPLIIAGLLSVVFRRLP